MPEDDDGSGGFLPDQAHGIGDVVGDEVTIPARRATVTALVERDNGPIFCERREKRFPVRPATRHAVKQQQDRT